MNNLKDLKEWYDTGQLKNGEQVVVSHMPNEFQDRRENFLNTSNDCAATNSDNTQAPDYNSEIEIEISKGKENSSNQESLLKNLALKVNSFSALVLQYSGTEEEKKAIKTEIENLYKEALELINEV